MADEHRHGTHPEIAKRLRRAEGHLRGVIEMMDQGRSCLDLAQTIACGRKGDRTGEEDVDPGPSRSLP